MTAPTSSPPLLPPSMAIRAGTGPAAGDEVLRRRDEIVEDVLLLVEHAGAVPGLAVLAAAAQVRQREHAAGVEEREVAGVVGGRAADVEPAVAAEQHRPLAVWTQAGAMDEEHRNRACRPAIGYQTCVV